MATLYSSQLVDFFRSIIEKMGFKAYYGNFNDYTEGFEFNPLPDHMIRIEIQFGDMPDEGKHISIYHYRFQLYPFEQKIQRSKMFCGQVILLDPSGEIDYKLYETILKYWEFF